MDVELIKMLKLAWYSVGSLVFYIYYTSWNVRHNFLALQKKEFWLALGPATLIFSDSTSNLAITWYWYSSISLELIQGLIISINLFIIRQLTFTTMNAYFFFYILYKTDLSNSFYHFLRWETLESQYMLKLHLYAKQKLYFIKQIF